MKSEASKTISYIPRTDLKQFELKRVAVYARVSRTGLEKHHSIVMQKSNLEAYVKEHPDWVFVDSYIDEGVTGTKLDRPEFNRLMKDVRDGKIDIILTKSVSRFGRNIMQVQKILNELRILGVTVIFENDNINTSSSDNLLLLQFLGIQAKEEAKQTSANQRWPIRHRFSNGLPSYHRLYGYYMEGGKFYIVPDEAEVVKRIFELYLDGMGRERICKLLNKENIPSPMGTKWRAFSIYGILTNDKYTGDMILQKWFVPNFLTKRKKLNEGELPRYIIEDAHEPIISKEIFERTQAELSRRARVYGRHSDTNSSPSNLRLFHRLIYCPHCDKYFNYKRKCSKDHERRIWACRDYLEFGKVACNNKAIPEDILIRCTYEVLVKQGLVKTPSKSTAESTNKSAINDSHLTNQFLKLHIKRIIAYPNQTLEYQLHNGEVVTLPWQFISRKESWTPEMKEKARERLLMRNTERREQK